MFQLGRTRNVPLNVQIQLLAMFQGKFFSLIFQALEQKLMIECKLPEKLKKKKNQSKKYLIRYSNKLTAILGLLFVI